MRTWLMQYSNAMFLACTAGRRGGQTSHYERRGPHVYVLAHRLPIFRQTLVSFESRTRSSKAISLLLATLGRC